MYTIIHRNEYNCKTSSVRSKLKRILFIGQWRDGCDVTSRNLRHNIQISAILYF